jgi:hypothetical protein
MFKFLPAQNGFGNGTTKGMFMLALVNPVGSIFRAGHGVLLDVVAL